MTTTSGTTTGVATTTELFLACADTAADLIASPAVSSSWDEPSALEGYTVAGLAGHLARAVLVVERYLDAAGDGSEAPSGPDDLLDASGYFAAVLGDHDPLDSELHRGVRDRGSETAADGPAALAGTVRAATERLRADLDEDALRRPIAVFGGSWMSLEGYLGTRLVELVVHLDDLAVSVDATPQIAEDACRVVAGILAETAARRQGGVTAVRALARRERHPDALRAL